MNAFAIAHKLAKIYRLAGFKTSDVTKVDAGAEGYFRFVVTGPSQREDMPDIVWGAVMVNHDRSVDFVGSRKEDLRSVVGT